MTIESCRYTLKIRGRSIGSQVLRSQENRRIVYLESQLTLQGSVDEKMVKQSSRVYRPDFHSLYFREENQDKSHKRSFEVRFDKDAGLVKVFKDGGDNATAPYILPYQDPLGLLYQLRFIPVDQEYIRIPMLGRDVTVFQLPEVELELKGKQKTARVFELQPGGSLVYIDSEAPHKILKLNQRIDQQVIEAELESFKEEEGYLNDDVRHSNKRDRSRRGGRNKDKSGRNKDKNSTRGRGRNRSESRSKSGRGRSQDASSSTGSGSSDSSKPSNSKPSRSRRRPSRSRPSNAKTSESGSSSGTDGGSSHQPSRPSRPKPSKNAPRSRRDSYQRSHKRNKTKDSE